MKNLIFFSGLLVYLTLSCTKEVDIEIPGFEEQLVIDGRIETGMPPIVLLSLSKEVFAPTDLNAFMNNFLTDAEVTVGNGTVTVTLVPFCTGSLPPELLDFAANGLGISPDSIALYNICGYTSLDPAIWGEVGKTYTLNVNRDGKNYAASTLIPPPTALDKLFWKPDGSSVLHGFSWATLSDPAGQFDAYLWEARRLKGPDSDPIFKKAYSPVTDDEFFDGKTFDFWYENMHASDEELADSVRWRYAYGDTVVIKVSKMDRYVYEFYEKKYIQLQTGGNPFATPTNVPNNISGGALGVWAGFSPWYDTLICIP